MRATLREHKARPGKQIDKGESPPPAKPVVTADYEISARERLRSWDWERNYAMRRDPASKSLFEYVSIVVHRDDLLALWPEKPGRSSPGPNMAEAPQKQNVTVPEPNTAEAWKKPTAKTALVVQLIDDLEQETKINPASIPQQDLLSRIRRRMPEKADKPGSHISFGLRTLQTAQAYRKRRDQPNS
jgi:hypothetical protein